MKSKVIRVSTQSYERLALIRRGFETPGQTIARLLDFFDKWWTEEEEGQDTTLCRKRQLLRKE